MFSCEIYKIRTIRTHLRIHVLTEYIRSLLLIISKGYFMKIIWSMWIFLSLLYLPNILTDITTVFLEVKIVKSSNQWNLRKSQVTRIKVNKEKPSMWWINNLPVNLQLSYEKKLFLNHEKVPKVVPACSYSKEGYLGWLKNSIIIRSL